MLSQLLFVLLVLVVAGLMAVDLIRTRGDSSRGHAERQAFGADRVIAAPPRTAAASMFSAEPARGTAAVPAPAATAPPAVLSSPPPGLSPRQGEAPRVFDQTNRELPRPAVSGGGHAGSGSVFVNLSRRSQALVERQLRLIESLERGEQDRRRLASLSRLNRIAMRMHRNLQNMLVLTGQEQATGWNQPVTLASLVEAAVSEVEDNGRVSLEVQPAIAVHGPAVYDAVHLLVELIDNATSFSAADMPVHIKGQLLTTGGALIDITDRGIGMAAREMSYANYQLDNPPRDIDVPKWMGLLVVARLAARHGIRVRLNQAEQGGLVALVWLPDEILTHYAAPADQGFGAPASRGPAPPASRGPVPPASRGPVPPASRGPVPPAPSFAPPPDPPAAGPDPGWQAGGPQATVRAESGIAARISGVPDRPGGADGDGRIGTQHAAGPGWTAPADEGNPGGS